MNRCENLLDGKHVSQYNLVDYSSVANGLGRFGIVSRRVHISVFFMTGAAGEYGKWDSTARGNVSYASTSRNQSLFSTLVFVAVMEG